MLNTKGSAAVEMIYVVMFFLAFITVVYRFSVLAGSARSSSVGLQNGVETMMIENGRPVCLETFDPPYAEGHIGAVFGNQPVTKSLTFVTRRICQEY